MYLIDTSVLIDFLKGKETIHTKKLDTILFHKIPFGISALTYQEVLQGAKNHREFDTLRRYLSTQKIYYPDFHTYEAAAHLFFTCRKKGVTVRNSIDALIAATALENNLTLLSCDKDFTHMARVVDLKIE